MRPSLQLPVRDLAKKRICDGHLFLMSEEGRKFYLMKPGILIDPSFIKRYATHHTVFHFQPILNEDVTEKFVATLTEFRYLEFEKDLKEKSLELMKLFQSSFSQNEHFLSWALASFKVFNDIPFDFILKMHETDLYLFRKSLYSAAFSIMIAVANDFHHPLIIKDIYNLTLMLDVGLCDSEYSYYVSQACNSENQKPGSGLSWLESHKASSAEIKVFTTHPERSYSFFKQNKDLLAHPELAEIALYQHELFDGKAFPQKIPRSLISSWESVVTLADTMVEIREEYNFEVDFLNYIHSFQSGKLGDPSIARVYKKLCQGLI
jgi:hypothetical protein